MAPVNSCSSASLMDIAMHMSGTSYSGCWGGFGASYSYFAGIFGVSHCIMAVSCIYTLLAAIFLIKVDKLIKKIVKKKLNLVLVFQINLK